MIVQILRSTIAQVLLVPHASHEIVKTWACIYMIIRRKKIRQSLLYVIQTQH